MSALSRTKAALARAGIPEDLAHEHWCDGHPWDMEGTNDDDCRCELEARLRQRALDVRERWAKPLPRAVARFRARKRVALLNA
jgi:hypothetical protein